MKHMFDDFHQMVNDAEKSWRELQSKTHASVRVKSSVSEPMPVHHQFNAATVGQRFKIAGRFIVLAARILWSGTVTIKLTKK